MRPCFITAAAVTEVLKWPDVIDAVRRVYGEASNEANAPRRLVARSDGAWLRVLAAALPGRRLMGAKVFGFSRHGGTYAMLLFDQETGALAGIVDGSPITALRTGATSALGLDHLAPRKPLAVGILGSGTEARAHLEALCHVRAIRSFKVFSPSPEHRAAFADRFRRQLGLAGEVVDEARAVVEGADVVIAAARSRGEQPILFGNWLEPGSVVVSIGSTLPEQREVDVSVVAKCDLVVCDQVDEVAAETGDMIAARQAGIAFADKLISLSDLVSGRAGARVTQARLPMLKTAGAAIQDLAVAELAFTKALAGGLSKELPGELSYKAV